MTTPADRVVDGQVAALLAGLAEGRDGAPPPATLDEERAAADATMLLIRRPVPDHVAVADHDVAVAGGTIRVRTHRPAADGPLPGYLFVHGGGWFQGTLDTAEVECGPVAETVPAVVCSVGYRLAPEHPFPTPLDDVVAAYEWFLAHAAELGVDPARIAVGGTSAGGNLAAALCLVVRDRGLPRPLFQWLEVPALDHSMSSPSMAEVGEGMGLTREAVRTYRDRYLPDPADRTDPRASPLLAEDLAGLPPACVLTAELDPVRDDGERYVRCLHEAGVPATGLRVLGHPHGTWIIPVSTTWRLLEELRTSTLRLAFAGALPGV